MRPAMRPAMQRGADDGTAAAVAASRFLVSGKVQGVFYRASTVRQAEQLGLRGTARNLADGRVEVLGVGSVAALDALAEWLRSGPPLAQVTAVVTEERDAAAYADVADFRAG